MVSDLKKINSGYAVIFLVFFVLFTLPAFAVYDVKQEGKTWYLQDNSLPIVSFKIAFTGAGSANDPAGKEGLAYFVSGMLNEGAGEYSSKEFQKLLDENAIEFSADVDEDNFYITVKTISKNLPLTLKMLNSALTKPSFAEKELETVRGQILSIIEKNKESSAKIANNELAKQVFGSHPYSKPEEGTLESVAAITAEDMRNYIKFNFRVNNITLSIVGDVDADKVKGIAEKITTGLSNIVFKKAPFPKVEQYPQAFDSHIKFDNPQSVIMFAKKGIKRDDPDFYAAYVLNHIIGGSGFQSLLYKEVREKRGLSYYIGTDFVTYDAAELFVGTLATSSEQVKEAKEVVRQVFRDIATNGISEQELAEAKSYITGSFPLNLDKNSKIASYILMMQLRGLDIDYLKNRNNYINSVTLEQINAVANKLLSAENLGFVTVGR